jgi:hypothetical protein
MLKKVIPILFAVFVSACAHTPSASQEKASCCQTSECSKGQGGECCQGSECSCCQGGGCEMCQGKKSHSSPAMSEGEECQACAQAEREWKARQGK